MFECFENYKLADKALIEKIIPYVREKVFDCWHYPPVLEIRPYDKDEFSLVLAYENEGVGGGIKETSEGHTAFDLVKAFIDGAKLQDTLISSMVIGAAKHGKLKE